RNLALVLLKQGRVQEAVAELGEGLRQDPDSFWLHFALGEARLAGGEVDAAVESFGRAVQLAPDSASARFNLANALIRLGRWEEARRHLEVLVEASPGDSNARYLLAMYRYQLGERAAAETELRRLLEESPGHAAAREALARMLLAARRFAEAAEEFSAIEPPTGESSAGAAVALSQAGRQREALILLEEGLRRLPGDGAVLLALARLLATCPDPALRDGPRALELAEELDRTQPTLLHAEAVAMALAATGDFSRAAEWQRSLVDQAREAGQALLAARLAADLRFYEQGRPIVRPLG
ncbi:MAG TPA: tetratricopeptide repeat protein, partial [Thermoanaerobaculia bacterium]|nr:tetratricopeptide repeat protein [Thermoanaerobaculia bacterium]